MPTRSTAVAVGYATNVLDFWLQIGKLAKQTRQYVHIYGYTGLVIPFIASHDVFSLVQHVLNTEDDSIVTGFVDRQADQISSLATTGSVLASISLSGLSKDYINQVHWTSKAFMLSSLMSALFCVVYAMRLQRALSACISAEKTKAWLRSTPERVWCRNKNRPSIATVLILDTPRTLVGMAIVSFLTGFSLYVVFVFVYDLDTTAGIQDSQNTMIVYFVALWFCIAMYLKADYFRYATSQDDTLVNIKAMNAAVGALITGRDMEEWDEEVIELELGPSSGRAAPPTRQSPQYRGAKDLETDANTLSLQEALDTVIATRERATQADTVLIQALELLRDD